MADQPAGNAAERSARPPDTLGDEGRAATVANMLRSLQARAFNLTVEATANGLTDDDPAPGAAPTPTGRVPTLSEERARIKQAEDRVVSEYGHLMPKVRQALGLDDE